MLLIFKNIDYCFDFISNNTPSPGGYILQQPQKYVLYFLNEIKTEENFHRLPRLTTTEILEGQTS